MGSIAITFAILALAASVRDAGVRISDALSKRHQVREEPKQ